MLMLIYIILIQGLIRPIPASSGFQPHCTIPPESTNFVFVSGANVRGTLDILWASLFTLITCCWTVQHLNIPRQLQRPKWPEGPKNVWRESVRYAYRLIKFSFFSAWPKIKWTLLVLVIPEFLVGKALQERYLAKKSVGEFKDLARRLGKRTEEFQWMEEHWTITHGFYANMGGFVLRIRCDGELQDIPLNCISLREMCEASASSKYKTTVIGPWSSIGMFKIPRITDDEINDKSKSDSLIKVITIGHLLWFVIQVAVRVSRGLAVSQLEIAVLAYAACTVFVFFLCLSKPQNVRAPTMLLAGEPTKFQGTLCSCSSSQSQDSAIPIPIPTLSEDDRDQILAKSYLTSWFGILRPFVTFGEAWDGKGMRLGPIPNDAVLTYAHSYNKVKIGRYSFTSTWIDIGSLVAGVVFGSTHCIAWTSHFPTPTEQVLWQVASVCTAALLPILALCKMAHYTPFSSESPSIHYTLSILEFLTSLAYLLARLYLVIEIFRTLYFLPSSAFVGTWTSDIPHFV
ncbi:hypothetical protein F4820DRAFT_464654 [Hypoxylon rubiginosum]|uniref:Uncharacterized protein n=1 Tax=Hypoxylon rubiginosum TaxID=110542 RepID=A0ACB9ZD82_9PEZI|nr:hypothetical protein F4820DRAFT_464654 [Hypoxylon rubiginosum]